LQAIKAGHWVLLDELNLATQQVLEGLNSCLDHRANVFIPELGRSFACPATFRIFATQVTHALCNGVIIAVLLSSPPCAQNPVVQGGGRRGLPKSFLNRFTKVYVEPLTTDDLYVISKAIFPALASSRIEYPVTMVPVAGSGAAHATPHTESTESALLHRMIDFNGVIARDSSAHVGTSSTFCSDDVASTNPGVASTPFGVQGRPWDFNLRDMSRWCSAVEPIASGMPAYHLLHCLSRSVDTVYVQRFRSPGDRIAVIQRFAAVFGQDAARYFELHDTPEIRLSPSAINVDDVWLPRAAVPGMWFLDPQLPQVEGPVSLEPLVTSLCFECPERPFPWAKDFSKANDSVLWSPQLSRRLYHLMRVCGQ
jgi:midasin